MSSLVESLVRCMQPYEIYKACRIFKVNGKFYWGSRKQDFTTLQDCKDNIDAACKSLFNSINKIV